MFEGSGAASLNPSDIVRPAPGAAHATERALLDLVDSIRCARLQRFAVGGFGPLSGNSSLPNRSRSHNGARATHNGAPHDQNALLAEPSRR